MQQKVTLQMNNKKHKTLKESLLENDLKWLVSDEVLVDMHKTKMGKDKDYIVLSIAVNDRIPANDLAQFIENSVYKFEDVEVSPATDSKGRYLIYVELPRNHNAIETIEGILHDTSKLSGIDEWKFKSMGMPGYIPLNAETMSQHLLLDPAEYDRLHPEQPEKEESEQGDEGQDETEHEAEQEEQQPTEESLTTESIKARLKFLMNY
jgi:hypothetical protein